MKGEPSQDLGEGRLYLLRIRERFQPLRMFGENEISVIRRNLRAYVENAIDVYFLQLSLSREQPFMNSTSTVSPLSNFGKFFDYWMVLPKKYKEKYWYVWTGPVCSYEIFQK